MKETSYIEADNREGDDYKKEITFASRLCWLLSITFICLFLHNSLKNVEIPRGEHIYVEGKIFGDGDNHLEKLVEKRIASWKGNKRNGKGIGPMDNIRRWVSNVSAYRGYIKDAARKYEIDETFLMALFAWESGGEPRAKSHKRATGFGQFVKVTALDKGLVINNVIDERLDPARSINAAASYIRDAARRYKSFSFMVTAYYNYGPGNLRKKIRKYGLTDGLFYKLPRETRKHYINIFAIKKLIDESDKYDFSFRWKPSHKKIIERSKLYLVKKGENLATIAEKKGVDLKVVLWKNPKIISPERMISGIVINI